MPVLFTLVYLSEIYHFNHIFNYYDNMLEEIGILKYIFIVYYLITTLSECLNQQF